MHSDAALPAEHEGPLDGAAVIHPVTDQMMASAARNAAALADGVAHHTVALDGVHGTSDAAPAAAGTAVSQPSRSALRPEDGAVEGAGGAARAGPTDALSRYNAKVFEVMRANVASTTALFAALVQAKSVPEALSLNAEHLRRQVEAFTSQGRELATLAQGIATDALRPTKGTDDR